ncbi:MAG: PTS sugar transporter subunit IIC [Clostridiaceae bacterium]|nr:PTS sugar transporter subunit IIC [Clostridiaceae bacterium]
MSNDDNNLLKNQLENSNKQRSNEENERTKPEQSGFKAFLKKQNIEISFKRYAIDAMGAMALGLFASLLIGTIVNTIANMVGVETSIGSILSQMGNFAAKATGSAMAIAIGYSLKAPPLVLFTLTGVGLAANEIAGAGGPLAVFIIALFATEIGKLVSKITPVDILVTPLVTLTVGVGLSLWWAPGIGAAANSVGAAIIWATDIQPFFMGIFVSVVMGIVLTLPISSAAIAAAFGLVGLAGGAAHAGCCAQMVGFAVMSYKENKIGGLIAQGLGTSMLQMPNIMRNPKIWLPPILASAITGPMATVLFKIEMNGAPISSGMGTSGLVGPIGVITGWLNPSEAALSHGAKAFNAGLMDYISLLLVSIVLPAILTYLIAIPFRKLNWIKENDLKLNLG